MKKLAPKIVNAATGLAFLLGAVSAQAAISWNFGGGGVGNDSGRTYTSTDDGTGTVNVDITAWTAPASSDLDAADLQSFDGGLGVRWGTESSSDGQHSMDNVGQFDVMLFAFSKEVTLSEIQKGWTNSEDADISVLAFDSSSGASAPTSTILESMDYTLAGVNTAGWDVVGNYDIKTNNTNEPINFADGAGNRVSSSYWLIGAWNSAFGSITNNGSTGNGPDYMKLLSLTALTPPGGNGTSSSVPEPSTLALLAIGLMAPAAMRRRREKIASE